MKLYIKFYFFHKYILISRQFCFDLSWRKVALFCYDYPTDRPVDANPFHYKQNNIKKQYPFHAGSNKTPVVLIFWNLCYYYVIAQKSKCYTLDALCALYFFIQIFLHSRKYTLYVQICVSDISYNPRSGFAGSICRGVTSCFTMGG